MAHARVALTGITRATRLELYVCRMPIGNATCVRMAVYDSLPMIFRLGHLIVVRVRAQVVENHVGLALGWSTTHCDLRFHGAITTFVSPQLTHGNCVWI
jgi:hypothetical protein